MAKLTSTAPSSTRTPAPAETPKLTKRRVSFKISAPEAQEVYLSGSFNEWSYTTTALKRDATGVWKTQLSLAPGTYEYRFVVRAFAPSRSGVVFWRKEPRKCAKKAPKRRGPSGCKGRGGFRLCLFRVFSGPFPRVSAVSFRQKTTPLPSHPRVLHRRLLG